MCVCAKYMTFMFEAFFVRLIQSVDCIEQVEVQCLVQRTQGCCGDLTGGYPQPFGCPVS